MFNLFYERPRGGNPRNHLLSLEDIRKKSIKKENLDMEIICDILYLLSSGDIGDFGMFETYKDRTYTNISCHKNQDLKSLYTYWIDDIWSYALLRKFRIDEFREYNNKLRSYENLKYFPVMNAMIDLRLGESFLFSDYQKSYDYTSMAMNELKDRCDFKYKIALNNMNYLKLVNKKDVETIDLNTLHPAELALYYILKKEYSKAINILSGLKNKQKNLLQYSNAILARQ
ncbi:AimR family lysis-lysogeny pheromone receptor [Bacillus wiedmannii]|uniref:AimR family lysis-lysogeny pheromone receptor n=1 Tax=Bacillus wiedmannii TaxID=1890302 RepID=UPI00211D78C9|nr:AimR family lysis-lysogeny pheromone receptor [Bacillus wiedmannii]